MQGLREVRDPVQVVPAQFQKDVSPSEDQGMQPLSGALDHDVALSEDGSDTPVEATARSVGPRPPLRTKCGAFGSLETRPSQDL
jgi:hypothetical protein